MASIPKKSAARKSKDKSLSSKKENARSSEKTNTSFFLETSRLIEIGLCVLFTLLVVVICFLGQRPKGPQVLLGHAAPARIVADFSFQYTSKILIDEKARSVRAEVPPVFQRSYKPYEDFRKVISDLNSRIAKSQIDFEAQGEETVQAELAKTIEELVESSKLEIEPAIILELTAQTTPKERSDLFNDALSVLKTLYDDGIYSSRSTEGAPGEVTVIQLVDEKGRANLPDARSANQALVALRVRIDALSGDTQTARLLFEIFRTGLQSNLLYSAKGTAGAIERAVGEIPPVIVSFKEGDTLIEPGVIVSELHLERLAAYREITRQRGGDSLIFNQLFMERVTLTILLIIAVVIYLKQGLREIHKRNRAIGVTAVSILLNLLIIRLLTEVGEIALLHSAPSTSMLPFIAPYALAPIMVAALVGAAPAVVSALIIAVLFGITQENSIAFLLIAFLSGAVGTYVASNIRKRSRLVRAGLVAGGTAALAGAALGFLNSLSVGLVGQQMLAALVVGLLTGIVAVGLLPVFEHLFKITTEITLLELTDFNHPLLRRMQMEAPGTYHHSLMVANLSENAAATIGASPLLCRVCCLFHDIGKLVKPEYFAENQKDGINPHDEKNPSMSALVIKAHVKEGVELARKFQLPRVIIDVIRQHHGTGLIQYFYYQAQQRQNIETRAPFPQKTGRPVEEKKVDESTYRYDGPRPAFKESAIIFFADGVEAASRSLKKVTQPAVEELIDNIIKSRVEDGQLDHCPLTFQELEQMRSSFTRTLLNMLHSRVEYPKEKKESDADASETSEKEPSSENEANRTGNQQPV